MRSSNDRAMLNHATFGNRGVGQPHVSFVNEAMEGQLSSQKVTQAGQASQSPQRGSFQEREGITGDSGFGKAVGESIMSYRLRVAYRTNSPIISGPRSAGNYCAELVPGVIAGDNQL